MEPAFGEVLNLEREPNNAVDSSAVAVKKEHKTVGHVPYNTASVISHFLMQFVEVTGKQRSWIWVGNTLYLSSVWTKALY